MAGSVKDEEKAAYEEGNGPVEENVAIAAG